MEILINASGQNRVTSPGRVDDAPASKQRGGRVEAEQPTSEPRAEQPQAPNQADVQRAADRLNQAMDSFNQNLSVSVDHDTGRMVVRVTDPRTGDVIRQIPPKQLLEAEVSINKIIGLFVNNKV